MTFFKHGSTLPRVMKTTPGGPKPTDPREDIITAGFRRPLKKVSDRCTFRPRAGHDARVARRH